MTRRLFLLAFPDMIEKNLDIPFIADLALHEKQIQQNYRPIIAVHKWFARRPGTLFRGLLLAEFLDRPLQNTYYQSNDLRGTTVADPFMGGGTPLIEANRLGCNVIGFDINPMSYWIVKQEIDHLDLEEYSRAASGLRAQLGKEVGGLYRTRCMVCGNEAAHVKYFLWVKTIPCRGCEREIDLFPGYLLAANSRHPKNVFVCPVCGELTETVDRKAPGACQHCRARLLTEGPAKRGRCKCPYCGTDNPFPNPSLGPPQHRLFAIEYHCPSCKPGHAGRFFKVPNAQDLDKVHQTEQQWSGTDARYVPDDEIPSGDETNRLHRWGYKRYREMFNARQLVGLECSARIITAIGNARVRNALATNLSDLLRYQNMLCRYDTVALKSLDIFSVHGFPVGLIQCESNILGIVDPNKNVCVGSGGWANIIEKFRKAKAYCDNPFEIRHRAGGAEVVPIKGEWIGDQADGQHLHEHRSVDLHCQDAAQVQLAPASLDAVLTDPPYYGNVQYAELMDFCYVWLRRLLRDEAEAFRDLTTRSPHELTANEDMGRGLEHFAIGLSTVFQQMAKALKPGAPLAFTYHHNDLEAYLPIAVAILDTGLTCSATLPCPAEMGASIHISGTGSSIIDTVFVCRSTGSVPRNWIADSPVEVAALVEEDLAGLRAGSVRPTSGDAKCIAYGHLIRLAIWNLRKVWDKRAPIGKRLITVASWIQEFGGWGEIEPHLSVTEDGVYDGPLFALREDHSRYGVTDAEVPF
jgi:adenine-specific DNA methylase